MGAGDAAPVHDVKKQLPTGATPDPRQTYIMRLWPYIEQTSLAAAETISSSIFILRPVTIDYTLNGLGGQGA